MALASELVGVSMDPLMACTVGGAFNLAVVATGSTQTNGTFITASNVISTGANGTTGVTLPAAQPGDSIWIFNNTASTLKVYPPNAAAIAVPGTGLGSANANYAQTANSMCVYKCFSATQWVVVKSA